MATTRTLRQRCTGILSPVVLLTLGGAVIRLATYDPGYFKDEFFTFRDVAPETISGVLRQIINGPEVSPPGYFVLLWPFAQASAPGLLWHVPGLLFGVALVPVVYALGARAGGRRAGVFAGLMTALAPSLIFFSNELRPYGLLALLACASTLFLAKGAASLRVQDWLAYAVLSSAAMWTHYTAVFPLGGQALAFLILQRGGRLRLIAFNLLAAVMFLPWLLNYREKGTLHYYGHMDWSPTRLPFAAVLPGEQGVPPNPFTRFDPASVYFLLWWILALILVVLALRARSARPVPMVVSLSAAAALSVFAGVAAMSEVSGWAMFTPRHVVLAAPYIAVVLGWAFSRVGPRVRLVGWLLLGIVAIGTVRHAGPSADRPAVWQASVLIAANARSGDVILDRTAGIGTRLRRPLRFAGVHRVIYRGGIVGYGTLRAARARGSSIWLVTGGSRSTSGRVKRLVERAGFRAVLARAYEGVDETLVMRFVPAIRVPNTGSDQLS